MTTLTFNPLDYKMDIVRVHENLESEKINKQLKAENSILKYLLLGVSIVVIIALVNHFQESEVRREKNRELTT